MEAKGNHFVFPRVVFYSAQACKTELNVLLGWLFSIFELKRFKRYRRLLPYPYRQVKKGEGKG